jgi:hypothetical protein
MELCLALTALRPNQEGFYPGPYDDVVELPLRPETWPIFGR